MSIETRFKKYPRYDIKVFEQQKFAGPIYINVTAETAIRVRDTNDTWYLIPVRWNESKEKQTMRRGDIVNMKLDAIKNVVVEAHKMFLAKPEHVDKMLESELILEKDSEQESEYERLIEQ